MAQPVLVHADRLLALHAARDATGRLDLAALRLAVEVRPRPPPQVSRPLARRAPSPPRRPRTLHYDVQDATGWPAGSWRLSWNGRWLAPDAATLDASPLDPLLLRGHLVGLKGGKGGCVQARRLSRALSTRRVPLRVRGACVGQRRPSPP